MKSPVPPKRKATDTTGSHRLLDIDGAAEHMAVTPRFVRSLVADRRIPYLKVGKFVRFDVGDLDTWLDSCRVEVDS